MEMAGSSNALDASAGTQDLKYMVASNVNVSNFVSVKLSGRINYKIWKAQMLCLIKSQELIHIIDAEYPFSGYKYDNLVKGWIFGTMSDHVLNNFAAFDLAQVVWMELESRFGLQIHVGEDAPFRAHDVSELTKDLRYMMASTVNVSNVVTVELSGHSNYDVWKTQMLCLVESHNLLHIIYPKDIYPGDKVDPMTQKYEKLVIGWILATLEDRVFSYFDYVPSVSYLWRMLEITFTNPTLRYSDREGDSWHFGEDLKYMRVSTVNVSNFVSVKLSGHSNYNIWEAQIKCLLKSQELLYVIAGVTDDPMTKKYNHLVKGWILGTMNDPLLNYFLKFDSAREVWRELQSMFSPPATYTEGFTFGTEAVRDVPELANTNRKKLYEAAVEGCWWKAESILKIQKNAFTETITTNGNTILHIAVEMGHDYFVEKLLEFIKEGNDIETTNSMGQTALHIAAIIGNIYAARLLVQKSQKLLVIQDQNASPPWMIASTNITIAYLLKSALSFDLRNNPDSYKKNAFAAINGAIYARQYDVASMLIEQFPDADIEIRKILAMLVVTFPTDLGFTESFIRPSFNNVRQKTVMRCSFLFHRNFLDIYINDILRVVKVCNYKCCSWLGKSSMILLVPIATLYPIYQLICLIILVIRLPFSTLYFLLWKILAVTVRPIKNIEKKKKEYRQAKRLLKVICQSMGKTNDGYRESLIGAILLDTYEVVDEILFTAPATINCKNYEGHNIVQLAIINRSEKVYNLIQHIIERLDSYKTLTDPFENTLLHLAGRLAPSSVLSRTTGAALQLQRELIWREEVEKLLHPGVLLSYNKHMETPAMVFTREHKDLMKEGEIWMKTTAESCSITAALIVTVVFAAAITVPGGSNQDSGIPVFRKETAFTIFAISNAFSLFTAATALLLYLSILTARFSEKDFLFSLPRRLIFGLLMLFLSTTAMMVAFGAILFLVFCDQRPWMLAPICVFACLPISVIVSVKLPLLVDLIQSTYSPIFGKKSYLEACQVNRKNTIYGVTGNSFMDSDDDRVFINSDSSTG